VRDNCIKILECHSIYKKQFKEKSSTDILSHRGFQILCHNTHRVHYAMTRQDVILSNFITE
jgi:hypothetical protein